MKSGNEPNRAGITKAFPPLTSHGGNYNSIIMDEDEEAKNKAVAVAARRVGDGDDGDDGDEEDSPASEAISQPLLPASTFSGQDTRTRETKIEIERGGERGQEREDS